MCSVVALALHLHPSPLSIKSYLNMNDRPERLQFKADRKLMHEMRKMITVYINSVEEHIVLMAPPLNVTFVSLGGPL